MKFYLTNTRRQLAGVLLTASSSVACAAHNDSEEIDSGGQLTEDHLDIIFTEGSDQMAARVEIPVADRAQKPAGDTQISATWTGANGETVEIEQWNPIDGETGIYSAQVPAHGNGFYELTVNAVTVNGEVVASIPVTRSVNVALGPNSMAPGPAELEFKSNCACAGATVQVSSSAAFFAGDCSDEIDGANGSQEIFGEGGRDTIEGKGGDDELRGGDCTDNISGNGGDDEIWGDGGIDYLEGNRGDDTLHGGGSDDDIEGNNGSDELYGGNGDDTLDGGTGTDLCNGGAGIDTFRRCEFITG